MYLDPNSTRIIPVVFRPRQTLGHFTDFLIRSFTIGRAARRRTFTIRRSVSASVGVQADIDILGPRTPYVAIPKSAARPRAEDRNIVEGPKLNTGVRMPWIKSVPLHKVPSFVGESLQGHDVAEQVSRAPATVTLEKLTILP